MSPSSAPAKSDASSARRAAVAGFRVVLEDLIPISLAMARQEIRQTLDDAVSSGALDQARADEAFARIDCATSIEDAARQAHIVMETGPDEPESKLEMFCLLDRICLPDTVIVSNCHALDLSRHRDQGGVHRRHVFFR